MLKTLNVIVVVIAICVTGFFAVSVITQQHTVNQTRALASQTHALVLTVKDNANAACVSASSARISQLHIDYDTYQEYAQVATTLSGSEQQIRINAADAILDQMKKIAAVRILKQSANQLPKPLSTIVTQTGFECPAK
jgi:hypothetical protein